MSVSKTVSLIALAALLGANVASAQTCTPPNSYALNGMCVPYYPYPGSGQVVDGQSVGTGSVLGASTSVPSTPTTSTSPSIDATGHSRVEIMVTDSAFIPPVVTVTEGATVAWVNSGASSHMIQFTSTPFGSGAASGLITPGGSYTRYFNIPGTYAYSDSPTAGVSALMTGTIIVVPAGSTVLSGSSVLGASTSVPNVPVSDGSATTIFNAVATGQTVVQVSAYDNFFTPHSVILPVGGTVTWTNRSNGTHTVIADDGSFASGAMGPNATYSHIFNVPGTYLYYDQSSGSRGGVGMFGTIVVLSPSQIAQTTGTGSVLGTTTAVPNVPNTGTGGEAAASVAVLGATGALLLLLSYTFLKRRFATA